MLADGDDLGLSIVVTPGVYSAFSCGVRGGPTVIVTTYPVAFDLFASAFGTGQSLVVTDVRQVPTDCWPAELKCRSRMHYYLADREARRREPGARALLLDHEGFVTEASTANLVAYFRGAGLVSPPKERILPGISVATLAELAGQVGIPFGELRPAGRRRRGGRRIVSDQHLAVPDSLHALERPADWRRSSRTGLRAAAGGLERSGGTGYRRASHEVRDAADAVIAP